MNILFIHPEFPDTFWSFKHAIEFIGKKATNPPLGLLTVAALLPEEWNKRLVDVNVETLTDLDIMWADYVFIGAMDIQRKSTVEIIARVKRLKTLVVAGGPMFTQEYEQFPNVDYFILNEAEITLPLFLSDLTQGTLKRIYQTAEYPDIRSTPIPQWDLLHLKYYDAMSIQFSRGCPFNCDFCNVTALFGHRPRTKTATQLVAELDALYKLGWRRNIFLVDDNFIGNKRQIKDEILPALIVWRKGKTGCLFLTEASINMADDDELLEMMAQAGFFSVFIGIETPDEASLAECNKSQNKNRNLLDDVKHIQNYGMVVMGGFIIGFDSDTPSIFQRQIDFIQAGGIVSAMVGLLQAPNGTALMDRMRSEGRLSNEMTGDNTDGTTNIIPKMDAGVLHRGYREVITRLSSPELFYQRVKNLLTELKPRRATVTLEANELAAFARSIIRLGIFGVERRQYWDLFFWTLFHYPGKFAQAITFTIYGYHFRMISELHIKTLPEPVASTRPTFQVVTSAGRAVPTAPRIK